MPQSYKFITAFLAFTGCISLVITGELVPVFLIPGVALIPGYYRFLRGCEPAPKWAIGVLSIATVGILAFDTVAVSGDFFVAVAHMTIVFQGLKSFDLREPWDHLQVYFMALLQLIMTSELALSMAVGGIFVVFLFILVAAIVLSHFLKEGTLGKVGLKKPVVIISLVAFVATAVFFVAVPRAKGGIWSRKSSKALRSVGFSGEVGFGSFGDVLKDPSIVMRVSVSGPRLPLYWRGTTLDYFDGTSWKDTLKRRFPIGKYRGRFDIRRGVQKRAETVQKIFLEPVDTDVVFGLGQITAIESGGRFLSRDIAGSLYLPAKSDRRFSYTAHSIPQGELRVKQRYVESYLQLPQGMERISALAREASTEATTALEAALLVESFLRSNYSYSLETASPPPGMTPVEDFLFNSKKGYCTHFATSMVLMLRSLGIPARVVTGFVGGDENALGDYIIVRQKDAHSWVDAGAGGKWARFDPTPPEPDEAASALALFFDSMKMHWYRYVVGFDFSDQRAILRSVSAPVFTMPEFIGVRFNVRPVYLIVLVVIAVPLAGRFLIKGFPGRKPFESMAYLKFKRTVKRRGGNVKPSSTPAEVAREALRLRMNAGNVEELVRLYEEARFGGRKLDGPAKKKYKELASSVCSGK
jgi:transglutaminase-like putative cysteine protease